MYIFIYLFLFSFNDFIDFTKFFNGFYSKIIIFSNCANFIVLLQFCISILHFDDFIHFLLSTFMLIVFYFKIIYLF